MKLLDSGLEAWYMADVGSGDQRLPNRKEVNEPCPLDVLSKLGVDAWKLSGNETDPELDELRKRFGFNYTDVICISPEKLPNYEDKIKMFFEEHLHLDPEIRYILEGSGYFDVRNLQEQWIRIKVEEGHLITLPKGIFHRFTLDDKNYIKAMRLFKGEPVWTPYNRNEEIENNEVRREYIQPLKIFASGTAQEMMARWFMKGFSRISLQPLIFNLSVISLMVTWISMASLGQQVEQLFSKPYFISFFVHSMYMIFLPLYFIPVFRLPLVSPGINPSLGPTSRQSLKSILAGKVSLIKIIYYSVPLCLISLASILFWYISLPHTSISGNSAVYQSSAVFVFVFSLCFLKQPYNTTKLLSVITCVVGVILVSLFGESHSAEKNVGKDGQIGDREGTLSDRLSRPSFLGYSSCFSSMILYSLFEVFYKKWFPEEVEECKDEDAENTNSAISKGEGRLFDVRGGEKSYLNSRDLGFGTLKEGMRIEGAYGLLDAPKWQNNGIDDETVAIGGLMKGRNSFSSDKHVDAVINFKSPGISSFKHWIEGSRSREERARGHYIPLRNQDGALYSDDGLPDNYGFALRTSRGRWADASKLDRLEGGIDMDDIAKACTTSMKTSFEDDAISHLQSQSSNYPGGFIRDIGRKPPVFSTSLSGKDSFRSSQYSPDLPQQMKTQMRVKEFDVSLEAEPTLQSHASSTRHYHLDNASSFNGKIVCEMNNTKDSRKIGRNASSFASFGGKFEGVHGRLVDGIAIDTNRSLNEEHQNESQDSLHESKCNFCDVISELPQDQISGAELRTGQLYTGGIPVDDWQLAHSTGDSTIVAHDGIPVFQDGEYGQHIYEEPPSLLHSSSSASLVLKNESESADNSMAPKSHNIRNKHDLELFRSTMGEAQVPLNNEYPQITPQQMLSCDAEELPNETAVRENEISKNRYILNNLNSASNFISTPAASFRDLSDNETFQALKTSQIAASAAAADKSFVQDAQARMGSSPEASIIWFQAPQAGSLVTDMDSELSRFDQQVGYENDVVKAANENAAATSSSLNPLRGVTMSAEDMGDAEFHPLSADDPLFDSGGGSAVAMHERGLRDGSDNSIAAVGFFNSLDVQEGGCNISTICVDEGDIANVHGGRTDYDNFVFAPANAASSEKNLVPFVEIDASTENHHDWDGSTQCNRAEQILLANHGEAQNKLEASFLSRAAPVSMLQKHNFNAASFEAPGCFYNKADKKLEDYQGFSRYPRDCSAVKYLQVEKGNSSSICAATDELGSPCLDDSNSGHSHATAASVSLLESHGIQEESVSFGSAGTRISPYLPKQSGSPLESVSPDLNHPGLPLAKSWGVTLHDGTVAGSQYPPLRHGFEAQHIASSPPTSRSVVQVAGLFQGEEANMMGSFSTADKEVLSSFRQEESSQSCISTCNSSFTFQGYPMEPSVSCFSDLPEFHKMTRDFVTFEPALPEEYFSAGNDTKSPALRVPDVERLPGDRIDEMTQRSFLDFHNQGDNTASRIQEWREAKPLISAEICTSGSSNEAKFIDSNLFDSGNSPLPVSSESSAHTVRIGLSDTFQDNYFSCEGTSSAHENFPVEPAVEKHGLSQYANSLSQKLPAASEGNQDNNPQKLLPSCVLKNESYQVASSDLSVSSTFEPRVATTLDGAVILRKNADEDLSLNYGLVPQFRRVQEHRSSPYEVSSFQHSSGQPLVTDQPSKTFRVGHRVPNNVSQHQVLSSLNSNDDSVRSLQNHTAKPPNISHAANPFGVVTLPPAHQNAKFFDLPLDANTSSTFGPKDISAVATPIVDVGSDIQQRGEAYSRSTSWRIDPIDFHGTQNATALAAAPLSSSPLLQARGGTQYSKNSFSQVIEPTTLRSHPKPHTRNTFGHQHLIPPSNNTSLKVVGNTHNKGTLHLNNSKDIDTKVAHDFDSYSLPEKQIKVTSARRQYASGSYRNSISHLSTSIAILGWIGLITFVLCAPGLMVIDLLGIETFTIPSGKVFNLCIALGLLDALFNFFLLLVISMTSPLIASIACLFVLPASIVWDALMGNYGLNFIGIIGVLCILSGIGIFITSEVQASRPVANSPLRGSAFQQVSFDSDDAHSVSTSFTTQSARRNSNLFSRRLSEFGFPASTVYTKQQSQQNLKLPHHEERLPASSADLAEKQLFSNHRRKDETLSHGKNSPTMERKRSLPSSPRNTASKRGGGMPLVGGDKGKRLLPVHYTDAFRIARLGLESTSDTRRLVGEELLKSSTTVRNEQLSPSNSEPIEDEDEDLMKQLGDFLPKLKIPKGTEI